MLSFQICNPVGHLRNNPMKEMLLRNSPYERMTKRNFDHTFKYWDIRLLAVYGAVFDHTLSR